MHASSTNVESRSKSLVPRSFPIRRVVPMFAATALACGAFASPVYAQSLCVESTASSYSGSLLTRALAVGDLDGDGRLDVVTANAQVPGVSVFSAPGAGVIQPPTNYTAIPDADAIDVADLDGDGDRDVVVVHRAIGTLSVTFNSGAGVLQPPSSYLAGSDPSRVKAADLDGDADADLVVVNPSLNSIGVLRNQGGGSFAPRVGVAVGLSPQNIAIADLDGDGDADIAVANHVIGQGIASISLLFNDGTGNFAPAVTLNEQVLGLAAADFDGDADVDLVAARYDGIRPLWNDGSGTFTPGTFLALANGCPSIATGDLDLDGDVDLVGKGSYPTTGPTPLTTFENQGAGVFAVSFTTALPGDPSLTADMDGDGDLDLPMVALGGIAIARNCGVSGRTVCLGDGSAAACPCGNTTAPSARAGCANSTAVGGTLRGTGSATLTDDDLVLSVADVPATAPVLIFQGSTISNAGSGVPFGDGLRCAGGATVRIALRVASGGTVAYPGPSDDSVHVAGFVGAAGERVYQAWYRDSAAFCTASTFNLTNGLVVRWGG